MDIPSDLLTLGVGLVGSAIGTYIGLRVGLVRLQGRFESMSEQIEQRFKNHETNQEKDFRRVEDRLEIVGKRTHGINEDCLVHDFELEDVMRKMAIPRKKRQNWRFDM